MTEPLTVEEVAPMVWAYYHTNPKVSALAEDWLRLREQLDDLQRQLNAKKRAEEVRLWHTRHD